MANEKKTTAPADDGPNFDVVTAAVRDLLNAKARLTEAQAAQETARKRVEEAHEVASEAEQRVRELLELEDDR